MKPKTAEMKEFLLASGWKFHDKLHQWQWSLPPLRALYTIENAYDMAKSNSRSK